jgi:hypothetical protein
MNPQEIHYYQTEKQVEAVAVIRVSHRLKNKRTGCAEYCRDSAKMAGWLAG